MPWQKAPPELIERFGAVLDRHPDLHRRPMFGYPAAFLGGHMVAGLHEDRWVARIGDTVPADLPGAPDAAPFEPMAGRPMRGFVVVPPAVVADDAAIDAWLRQAAAHVRTLPPKT